MRIVAKGARAAKGSEKSRPRPLSDSVLQLIWREKQISRAEIARRADLSRSTVSGIVDALLPTGLVAEMGMGPSSGGRRPVVLEFQDDACVILGVEMGATHVTAALIDLRGRVLATETRNHPVRTDPDGTRALIIQLCDVCLARSEKSRGTLVGIGVAVPSPVDPRNPLGLSEVVMPDWKGGSGLDMLEKHYKVPVMVDNDANLGALAERWWGAGQGVDDLAYIKLGTGLGSGHVIGGEIYRGASGIAGEIGHLAIDPHGPPCICGLRGCLATLVGAPALVARAHELAAEYPGSALAAGTADIMAIEDAALVGDPLALQVTREAAENLGIAVSGMLNLMNPSIVILGGGFSRLGELLLAPLRNAVLRRTLLSSVTASEIRMSALGPMSVATGAASMVLKEALSNPRLFPAAAQRKGAR